MMASPDEKNMIGLCQSTFGCFFVKEGKWKSSKNAPTS